MNDAIWLALCTILVFLMQAGLLCLEMGLTRQQHVVTVALKNLVDWCIVCLVFYGLGFGLLAGQSWHGLFGVSLFAFQSWGALGGDNPGLHFLFFLTFVGTSTTIVSGALAERTSFLSYMLTSLVVGLVIFPVFGHWVWGHLFLPGNTSWLHDWGYFDFAGASTVHLLAGLVSLVGIWQVGPRLGRFSSEGEVEEFKPASQGLASLGVLLLWVGWWGFNAGSLLHFDPEKVAMVILNTNLAGAAGALAAFVHGLSVQKGQQLPAKIMGGALGGLVASTAFASLASPLGAIFVGLLAGVVHNLSFHWLRRWHLDDPMDVIPVHACCAILGLLAVPWVGPLDLLPTGSRLTQTGVQLLGVVVCCLWTCGLSFVLFKGLKRWVGLRVSPQEERYGVPVLGQASETEFS